MSGVFEKVRVLVLSNVHSLLDRAIDLNSTQAVKQHVRDLESALTKLESAAAESAGSLRTLRRERGVLQNRESVLNSEIDLILTDVDEKNDHLATVKQVQLDALIKQIEDVVADIQDGESMTQKLEEGVSALRMKHSQMLQQVQRLERLESSTKAKASAAESMKMVSKMVSSGETVSVDNIVDRMRRQGDVADEKFDRAFGQFNNANNKDTAVALAKAKIEERKRKLVSKTS